ncbi:MULTISPECIES: hypothetical protein [Acetobacter]|uniref:Uncharacterized protein n=1 Tax=Acetobacter pomorum TaxID=65959 RepID=A0AAN1PKC1_9PROT|nr:MULTISPECIES: hypothetical protein [Acetobacter]AXN01801.1 hypothetical protein CJF59_14285 [Acetobacter pomorum]KAA8392229.1 hypothetical protein FKW22_13755 [Acetobacter sp. DmW_125124]KAA8394584.1 hypothetical protein FKW19_12205 [Acetobacter sp. DmW_125128]KAA8397892.1 hypothetical protein FKW20_08180 [Acetobacter sp. DmW_125127]KAA8402200.1 hypothetical protein FKW32_14270 [Acetobacter sp. DmW_125132]
MSKKDNPPPQTAKKGIIRTSVKVATHITGSPVEAVGWRRIISNFNVIRLLWTILKLSARPNPEETVNGKGQEILDSPAQADVVGRQLPSIRQAVSYSHLSDQDLALVIMRRQKETFIRAYSAGLIATVLFGLWALEMIFFPWTGNRLLASIAFLPFLALLGSVSLWNCSLNWQLRTGQIATFRQFMDRADSIFPRLPIMKGPLK